MAYSHNYWAPIFAGLIAGVATAQLMISGTKYVHYVSFPVIFSLIWLLIVLRRPLLKKGSST